MLSKNQIKKICGLQRKKERMRSGLYVVEGNTIVDEMIVDSNLWVELYATSKWFDNYPKYSNLANTFEITDKELAKISSFKTPNEVLLLMRQKTDVDFSDVQSTDLILALDGIKDPGNMGTMIRLADWFGVQHILCSSDSVDQYNPKTIQSAMGSINRVQVYYGDLTHMLGCLKSHKIYACDLEGESIYDQLFVKKAVIVMGSESHGLSNEVLNHVHEKIKIPLASSSKIDSLNVASAAAISLSVFRSK